MFLRYRSQNAEKDWDLKTDGRDEDWSFIIRKENIKASAHKNFFLQLTTRNAVPPMQSSLIRSWQFNPKFITYTALLPLGQWKWNSSAVENSDSITLEKERSWKTGCNSRPDQKHSQAKDMVHCTATHTHLSYNLFLNNSHICKQMERGNRKNENTITPLKEAF